jgi:hypothetical protein
VYHDLDAWRRYMSLAGFVELSYYYRPVGVPRERQPWLASVWRRLASWKIMGLDLSLGAACFPLSNGLDPNTREIGI